MASDHIEGGGQKRDRLDQVHPVGRMLLDQAPLLERQGIGRARS